ncbi:MAG: hypothetical protein IKL44_06350 [Clostridia bacterium]|nr:hypothetical protein [Clostridia bacterium]MBR3594274.1 hypothetical protein [Clostridia bacterium]
MKKIVVITVLIFLFSVPVSADVYEEQYDLSGVGDLALPDGAKDILSEFDLDPRESDWIEQINTGNVFTIIINQIKNGGTAPLKAGLTIISLVVIIAAFGTFFEEKNSVVLGYVSTLSISAAALLPAFSVILSTARSIKAGAQFMISFVPVYTSVLLSSGKPLTSAASGGILLAASEGIVQLSTYVIAPLVGSYLAVCICGSVSPLLQTDGIADFLKKAANWILGLVMTVYIGVLTIQTTVNSAADGLAVRTGRFLIGNFVPVVGGALSEALVTVQSSMSLLRSSVGAYGVIVLIVTVLPVVIELCLWRLSLLVCSSAASLFGLGRAASLLKCTDAALSFLLGILLICSVAFIVSLAVTVSIGG